MDKATWERRIARILKFFLSVIVLFSVERAVHYTIHTVTPERIKCIQCGLESGLRAVQPLELSEMYIDKLKSIWFEKLPSEDEISLSHFFQRCVPEQQAEIRNPSFSSLGSYALYSEYIQCYDVTYQSYSYLFAKRIIDEKQLLDCA